MSLLTIVQDAANEIGFPEPATVIGNSDQLAIQMLRLLNREGDTLSRFDWEALKEEEVSELERDGLIKRFEFSFELASYKYGFIPTNHSSEIYE